MIFPGKQLPKKKKKPLSKLEKEHDDESAPQDSTPSEHQDTHDDVDKEKTIRKSTRTAVVVRQAERDAIRAALQATMKVQNKSFQSFMLQKKCLIIIY